MPMVEAHRPPALGDVLPPGGTTGIGSLPHRSVHEAAAFALREYDLPTIPTLPRRSPAEGMIAQAVVGIHGITLGQYGSIAVDRRAVDPMLARRHRSRQRRVRRAARRSCDGRRRASARAVKWQFVGPVTLGVALTRGGIPATPRSTSRCAPCAPTWQRSPTPSPTALPESPQVVWLDEPWFGELMHPGFPIAPDPAIDLLSSAMAAVQPMATVGVHCCADVDIASLLRRRPGRSCRSRSTSSSPAVAGYLVAVPRSAAAASPGVRCPPTVRSRRRTIGRGGGLSDCGASWSARVRPGAAARSAASSRRTAVSGCTRRPSPSASAG